MLGQRRIRWPNIVPTLGEYLAFAGKSRQHEAFTQWCFNVGPASSTLAQD